VSSEFTLVDALMEMEELQANRWVAHTIWQGIRR